MSALPLSASAQAGLDEERAQLVREFEQQDVELQRHHDEEVKRIMQTPPGRLQQRPRSIIGPKELEEHKIWQDQEFARLTIELQEAKAQARQDFGARENKLVAKWELISAEQNRQYEEMLREKDEKDRDGQNADYWRARYEALEAMCRDSQLQLQHLKERNAFLETRRMSTFGNWTYRSCPVDHPSTMVEYLNKVQPTPDSIMGCVVLPMVHLWVRHEDTPSGLRYSLKRQQWKLEDAPALLQRGNVIILGVTLGGELFYLNIDNPVFSMPPAPSTMLPAAPLSGFAWEDVSGVLFKEEHLQAEFDRLGKDEEGTIDSRTFMDLYGRLFLRGLIEPDPSIESLLAKYNIHAEGRMNFDEFCLLMLMIAKR